MRQQQGQRRRILNQSTIEDKENSNVSNSLHPNLAPLKLHKSLSDPTENSQLHVRLSNEDCGNRMIDEIQPSLLTTKIAILPDCEPIIPNFKKPYNDREMFSAQISQNYSSSILNHLCNSSQPNFGFLQQHNISEGLRAKMIDWMIEVLGSYKMSEETFFKSVLYMDLYLKKSQKRQETRNIHLIGICCMLLAAKGQEIYPLRLKTLIDKIGRGKFKKQEIIEKEADIVNTLGFGLEVVTVYELMRHILSILPELKPQKKGSDKEISTRAFRYLEKVCLYLAKLSRHSYRLSEIPIPLATVSVIYIGLKTSQQLFPELNPDTCLHSICSLLGKSGNITPEDVIDVSGELLDLAKTFSKMFPSLENLNKFNKIEDEIASSSKLQSEEIAEEGQKVGSMYEEN